MFLANFFSLVNVLYLAERVQLNRKDFPVFQGSLSTNCWRTVLFMPDQKKLIPNNTPHQTPPAHFPVCSSSRLNCPTPKRIAHSDRSDR